MAPNTRTHNYIQHIIPNDIEMDALINLLSSFKDTLEDAKLVVDDCDLNGGGYYDDYCDHIQGSITVVGWSRKSPEDIAHEEKLRKQAAKINQERAAKAKATKLKNAKLKAKKLLKSNPDLLELVINTPMLHVEHKKIMAASELHLLIKNTPGLLDELENDK